MEGNRHIDRTDAVVRPVFQKEGNVYVRGKSGSGKTTLQYSEEEEDAPMFRSTISSCYNIIHHYNEANGGI